MHVHCSLMLIGIEWRCPMSKECWAPTMARSSARLKVSRR